MNSIRTMVFVMIGTALAWLPSSYVFGSEPIHVTSHTTPIERVEGSILRIQQMLESDDSREFSDGLKALKDLSFSTHAYRTRSNSFLEPCYELPDDFMFWAHEVRRMLREKLGPTIDQLICDERTSVQGRALRIAGNISWWSEEIEDLVLNHLSDSSTSLRSDSQLYLGRLGEQGVAIVLGRLPGETSRERQSLYRALPAIQSIKSYPEALASTLTDTLVVALQDYDEVIAGSAAYTLRKPGFDGEDVEVALIGATRSPFESVRHNSLEALQCHDGVEYRYYDELVACLADNAHQVITSALTILDRRGDVDSLLISTLDSEAWQARTQAMTLLGKRNLPNDKLVKLAIKGLEIEVAPWSAARVCEELGPRAEEAWEALNQTLTASPNSFCRDIVLRAMISVDERNERSVAILRQEWANSVGRDRDSLIDLFTLLGSRAEAMLPEIEEALGNPDGSAYRKALRAVKEIGTGVSSLAPIIVQGLASDRWWIQKDALEALIVLGPGFCAVREEVEAIAWDDTYSPRIRALAGEAVLHLDCTQANELNGDR